MLRRRPESSSARSSSSVRRRSRTRVWRGWTAAQLPGARRLARRAPSLVRPHRLAAGSRPSSVGLSIAHEVRSRTKSDAGSPRADRVDSVAQPPGVVERRPVGEVDVGEPAAAMVDAGPAPALTPLMHDLVAQRPLHLHPRAALHDMAPGRKQLAIPFAVGQARHHSVHPRTVARGGELRNPLRDLTIRAITVPDRNWRESMAEVITRDSLAEMWKAKVEDEEGGTYAMTRARDDVRWFFDAITGALQKGGEVHIHGFGNFKIQQRAARMGRNPRTGEAVKVPGAQGGSLLSLRDPVRVPQGQRPPRQALSPAAPCRPAPRGQPAWPVRRQTSASPRVAAGGRVRGDGREWCWGPGPSRGRAGGHPPPPGLASRLAASVRRRSRARHRRSRCRRREASTWCPPTGSARQPRPPPRSSRSDRSRR
jgi:DNA-binding protein HU-beta